MPDPNPTPIPTSARQIAVVIISYNTRALTLACLASIYRQTSAAVEVIVVDNASTDGSAEAIGAAFPKVKLLAETQNHGFGRAHHLAVPQTSAPWLLLLNPDTELRDPAIDRLLAFAEANPDAGIYGGRTYFGSGRLNPSSCWRRMTLRSLFCRASGLSAIFPRSDYLNPEAFGGWKRDQVRDVDIVSGCFFLIRREAWLALGGFDPAFVMYGEEADLCLRARSQGLRPVITPEAGIIHHGGASEPIRTEKMVRLLRAKSELIKRHFAPRQRRLGRAFLMAWPASRYLALAIVSRLPGQAARRERAQSWGEVWRRRSEWCDGF